jgi:hypothetical protein
MPDTLGEKIRVALNSVHIIETSWEISNDLRDKLLGLVAQVDSEVERLKQTLAEDCCLKSEASQRIFNAQNEAAQIYNPLIAELKQEAASLRNETATANLSRLELQNLARRVVEIFEPMQQKGQNGHTFELLLERAKKCLATVPVESNSAVSAPNP